MGNSIRRANAKSVILSQIALGPNAGVAVLEQKALVFAKGVGYFRA